MKKWVRLKSDEACGSCGQKILAGDPVCLLMPDKLKYPLIRCASCVGPAPTDLEESPHESH